MLNLPRVVGKHAVVGWFGVVGAVGVDCVHVVEETLVPILLEELEQLAVDLVGTGALPLLVVGAGIDERVEPTPETPVAAVAPSRAIPHPNLRVGYVVRQ